MSKTADSFVNLGLNRHIINVLHDIGYEKPLPIQTQCIPYLLAGYDVLGMAHTGSGKTAAFVLPLLHNIDTSNSCSQGLIITPTRELAIQIGRVCSNFARYMKKINVVTLYGGQSYNTQLSALNKRPHILVSTPGRLIDHLNRGTANLSQLKTLVIDEADEMLRMGFIEDVERIIKNIPIQHQTALFSATLPMGIRRISYRFMNNPKEIYIHTDTSMCTNIRQNYWLVCGGITKHEALMRFLETEDFDAAIVFVRTKYATLEISEILERFGYNSAALNGDMNQTIRHQTLDRLRHGKLDILIATDVAARGLDIHRISLVINYDIPINSDAYIHRIGRTGRAGRIGKSLLFVERKEYRLLRYIERRINLKIPEIQYPTSKTLLARRLSRFTNKIEYQLSIDNNNLDIYQSLLSQIKPRKDLTTENLAAVLLKIAQGNRPLVLPPDPTIKNKPVFEMRIKNSNRQDNFRVANRIIKTRSRSKISDNMDAYHISVGRNDGVKIRHIVKVLANKIDNIRYDEIGNIRLFSFHAIIELNKGLSSSKILTQLSHARILNKPINMKFLGSTSSCNKVH